MKTRILIISFAIILTFSFNIQAESIESIRIETDYPSVTRQGFFSNKTYEIRTPWQPYLNGKELSEPELLRHIGEEELASQAASFHSTKTFYTFSGFGLATAGLGLAGSEIYSGDISPVMLIGGSALGITGGFLASYGMNMPSNYLKVNEIENLIETQKVTSDFNIEPSIFISNKSIAISLSRKF